MDMRAALNDLQIMAVDARSSENGVKGNRSGEQMEAWKVALRKLDLWIIANTRVVSATSNWTQTE